MTDVFLIYPPIYYQDGEPKALDVSVPPLGILYLAAVLKKEGISVRVIDVTACRQSLSVTLKLIAKHQPKLVGIYAMTPMLQGAVSLAKAIKKKFRQRVSLSLGGPHLSADPGFIKRFPSFDFGVTGEAEVTFTKLTKKLLAGQKINGVYQGEPVRDLSRLPWPARDLVDQASYLPRASIMATRGCPFHCYYCSRPAVSNLVRLRNPKDIVDEMESLLPICRGEYQFQDDSLTINRKHTLNLCKEIIKRKIKARWSCYTRIDLVDLPLLKKMVAAGCENITFGIESASERVRTEIIRKKFTNREMEKKLALCRQAGIGLGGFFMLGLPGETKAEVRETINFFLSHDFDIIGFSIATPLPGSDLWQAGVKAGIVSQKFIDQFAQGKLGAGYAGVYPVYQSRELPLKWLYQTRRQSLRRFYLRPKFILRRLEKDLLRPAQLLTDFKEGLSVFWRGSSWRSPYQKELVNKKGE